MTKTVAEQTAEEQGVKLNDNRLTPDKIEATIKNEEYFLVDGTCLTICVLTLQNGFQVTGNAACVDPANFNAEIGRKVARTKAINEIWPLEGYLLKQRLFEPSQ